MNAPARVAEMPPLPEFTTMRQVRRMFGDAPPSTIHGLVRDGLLPAPFYPRRNWPLFERASLLEAVERLRLRRRATS